MYFMANASAENKGVWESDMKILIVDENRKDLEELYGCIRKACEDAEILRFDKASDAVAALRGIDPDVAFLRIEMESMSGLMIAEVMKCMFPAVNLILVSDNGDHYADAFRLRVSGYLRLPVTVEMVREELSSLRYRKKTGKTDALQIVGESDIYASGRPVRFKYNKTRELVQYLIGLDGKTCSTEDLPEVLWNEYGDRHRSYLRNILADLSNAMKAAGCENLLIRRRGRVGIRLVEKREPDAN